MEEDILERRREIVEEVHIHLHIGRIDVHVHQHQDTPAPAPPTPPAPSSAVAAHITIGGNMPGQITVDTTNETVAIQFVDDKGDPTGAPDGAQVNFTSDNPGVATVATDPNNPLQGDITPVAPGAANISASITDANGQPINDPNGQPFNVAPVAVTVSPGQAAGASLVLSA